VRCLVRLAVLDQAGHVPRTYEPQRTGFRRCARAQASQISSTPRPGSRPTASTTRSSRRVWTNRVPAARSWHRRHTTPPKAPGQVFYSDDDRLARWPCARASTICLRRAASARTWLCAEPFTNRASRRYSTCVITRSSGLHPRHILGLATQPVGQVLRRHGHVGASVMTFKDFSAALVPTEFRAGHDP